MGFTQPCLKKQTEAKLGNLLHEIFKYNHLRGVLEMFGPVLCVAVMSLVPLCEHLECYLFSISITKYLKQSPEGIMWQETVQIQISST